MKELRCILCNAELPIGSFKTKRFCNACAYKKRLLASKEWRSTFLRINGRPYNSNRKPKDLLLDEGKKVSTN